MIVWLVIKNSVVLFFQKNEGRVNKLMESDLTYFLADVHGCLSRHPLFKKPINYQLTEGLDLINARIAIWYFIGSIEHRLNISQLQFLVRVFDRQIVPKGVKTTFRKGVFRSDQARNKKFIYNLARARRRVAKEITRKRRYNTTFQKKSKIISIRH